jgi:hypothetical protein
MCTPPKEKVAKRKSAAAGNACGGGKGEPKSGPFGALKRKSPPPFPPGSGHGNDGKPVGFTTFPQPPPTPLFPSDFLPVRERNLRDFFEGQKALSSAYIINIFFSLF